MVRFDHRVTDVTVVGVALSSLEQILNDQIADELLALRPPEQAIADPPPGRIGSRFAGRTSR
jgi:hypothetical protein